MQDISNTALKGIRKFIEKYPLKPPQATDIQRHTDPNENFGSVLPLLQKTMEFAPGSTESMCKLPNSRIPGSDLHWNL
jgi:hypothetical protein